MLRGMAVILFGLAISIESLAVQTPSPSKELSLLETIHLALANSSQLEVTRHQLSGEAANLELVKSKFFPTIDAGFSAGTVREYRADNISLLTSAAKKEAAEEVEYNNYEGSVSFVFNIFRGFQDIAALRKASAQRDKSENEHLLNRSEVIRKAILTYFGVQREKRKLTAEIEIKKLRESQLQDIKNRRQSGKDTELELLQAQYALSQQKPAIRRIETNIVIYTQQLIRLTGLDLSTSVKLTDSMGAAVAAIEKETKNTQLNELYKQALELNPAIAQLKAEEQTLDQERVKLRGMHLPSVDFVLEGKSQAERANELGEEANNRYSGMLQVSIPIFSGFSSVREQSAAAAAIAANRARQTQKREETLLNLSDAVQQLDLAKEEIDAQEINTKLADEAIKRAESLYKLGRITLTDLLQAYTDRIKASQLLADALYRRIESNVTLLHESGLLAGRPWD